VTETVFNWPGIGSLLVESIQRRDYPVVQGCVLMISLSYVAINLLTDLLYAWVDPRVRLGQGRY
jgi:peptide/nickel transport system permease protein